MVTSTDTAHLDFNSLNHSEPRGQLFSNISKKAFMQKAFFFFCLTHLISPLYGQNNLEELKIAVFDTGFCPSENIKHPKVSIAPVIDVTQTNTYKCQKSKLAGPRFHGHRVLDVFISSLAKSGISRKILITPFVIFDKNAQQRLRYWKKALELAQDHDIIISAAGMPLHPNKEKRLKQLKEATLPRKLMLLTSGRKAADISINTKLYPQEFHELKNIYLLGSYHAALFKGSKAVADNALLYSNHISFYFPYMGKLHPKLKGASRALATGAAKIISTCFVDSGQVPSMKRLNSCLEGRKHLVELKYSKTPLKTIL